MTSSDDLKDEIQGSGFLEEVKEDRLPKPERLTGAAFNKYERTYSTLEPSYIRKHADKILEKLLELERDIYKEREMHVYREALTIFIREYYDTGQTSLAGFGTESNNQFANYPHLQELFSEIKEIYETADNFEDAFSEILPKLYPAMDAISVSAQQSRRKRAGSSLKNHVDRLITRSEYSIEQTHPAGNGYLYEIRQDAQLPEKVNTIYISFLTTLSDRFRQSLSDGSIRDEDVPQFILTGSGNNIFTSSSKSDVTGQKVREITNEGFTLVAFQSIRSQFEQGGGAVISFSEFFTNRLPEIVHSQ